MDYAVNKSISATILRYLVLASLLFASSMLRARAETIGFAQEENRTKGEEASDMLKNLRSAEDALTEKLKEQLDNARLLDELMADKKTLSTLQLPEDVSKLLESAITRIAKLSQNSDVQPIIDDLLGVQKQFVSPFEQIVNSLWQERRYSRSPAANKTTANLGDLMYPLIKEAVYSTDIAALKPKIVERKTVPGDFPFTKVAFDKLRNDMIKSLDLKIGELTENADLLNRDIIAKQKVVNDRDRDLRNKVDDDFKKISSYLSLGSYGFLSMTAVLLAALLSLFFVARNAHLSGFLRDFLRWNPLLDLSTVFILTLAIIMLGLNDKLSPEVLGTLLGGISGYVLGRASRAAGASAERSEIKTLLESKSSGGSGSPPASE